MDELLQHAFQLFQKWWLNAQNAGSGWGQIRSTRHKLKLTLRQAAAKLEMHHATLHNIEKREMYGQVTLATLRKIAHAFNCDFIYYFTPKGQKHFAEKEWDEIWPLALKYLQLNRQLRKDKTPIKPGELVYIAKLIRNDAQFRRMKRWSERGIYHQEGPGALTATRWHMAKVREVLLDRDFSYDLMKDRKGNQ